MTDDTFQFQRPCFAVTVSDLADAHVPRRPGLPPRVRPFVVRTAASCRAIVDPVQYRVGSHDRETNGYDTLVHFLDFDQQHDSTKAT